MINEYLKKKYEFRKAQQKSDTRSHTVCGVGVYVPHYE